MSNSLTVTNLSKEFKDFSLNNISFELREGEVTGIIGENGSGKTTLFKSLLGLVNPSSGEIKFWEEDLEKNKESVGVVFDELNINEFLTAKLIEKIYRISYSSWDSSLFKELLKKFGIPLEKKVKDLSRGMKMKLQIAIALAHHPKLLLLDEITSGLDPNMRDSIMEILYDYIQDDSNSILISSHNLEDLEKIVDNILFIKNGHLVFNSSIMDLTDSFLVAHCNKENYQLIDKEFIVGQKETDLGYEILIKNPNEFIYKFPNISTETVNLNKLFKLFE